MKKILSSFLITLVAVLSFAPGAFAAATILPALDPDIEEAIPCDPEASTWNDTYGLWFENEEALQESYESDDYDKEDYEFIFACALKTGYISFWMIQYYVVIAMNFIIGLAGLIAILMILVGAYYYIAGGITDDKEKGKTVIKYALGGLVLTMLAWFIVNVLLLALTS